MSTPHPTACGFENPPGAQFCGTCGRPLAVTCGRCGTEVPAGFSFCTACGNALTETQSHHAQPAEGTADRLPISSVGEQAIREVPPGEAPFERRLVSVLFCDLENFTGLAESLDPEEVRDILSRYFEAARGIVARFGGTIEKFIGDAVVGVWGTPVAREDDAERAVRAALEIVVAVAALRSAALPKPLAARAAVATGESAVVLGLENQGMVAGDIMNTAARLQGAAEPGSVLMNDATRRATARVITARPAGTARLKGKATPVHTWLALRPVKAARRAEAQAPLVGRRRELEELIKAFYGVKRSGRGRLVSLAGVAGIGKTRLVREMERRLRVRHTAVAWYAGRAPWHGAGTAFAPLAAMARQALDIGDDETTEVGIRKLRVGLEDLIPDDRERDWLVPRVAVLIDPDKEGDFAREELFAAWGRLFEAQAERRPVVMVIEDAQRADPALLDFVEYLVNAAFDRPLLMVTLARPELLEQRSGWGANLRNFSSLHLGRLTGGEITQLLTALSPGLTKAVVARVVRRADGVPLYAVEIARMLEGGGAGRRLASSDDVLPTSLHALIAARIDGLGEVERSLLMSAAVLGRRFTTAALGAVAGTGPEESGRSLEILLRQEMLTRDRDVRTWGSGSIRLPGATGPRCRVSDACPRRAPTPASARSRLPREPQ